jgi:hypothetical protein
MVSSIRRWTADVKAMAGRGNLVEHGVGLVGMPAYDMQDLAENLALEPLCAVDLKRGARRRRRARPRPAAGIDRAPVIRCACRSKVSRAAPSMI